MSKGERSPEGSAPRFGGALRTALFYLVLIVIPVVVYYIFYVDTRVEQTEVRNFRALDAAATRLKTVIANLHGIAANVPVGVPSSEFRKILETTRGTVDDPARPALEARAQRLAQELRERERAYNAVLTAARSKEAQLQQAQPLQQLLSGMKVAQAAISAEVLRARDDLRLTQVELDRIRNRLAADCSTQSIFQVLTTIDSISETYLRDFRAVASDTDFELHPLMLTTTTDENGADVESSDAEESGNQTSTDAGSDDPQRCIKAIADSLDKQLQAFSGICRGAAGERVRGEYSVRRRLVEGAAGIVVESQDCRSFEQRSKILAEAIPADSEELVRVLNRYGVGVRASLRGLVEGVAANVAPLFDQYLIADRSGRVLYSAPRDAFRHEGVTGTPSVHRSRLDFVNHVDLSKLVDDSARQRKAPGQEDLQKAGFDTESISGNYMDRYGIHSRVAEISVGDIEFQAFVHPFEVTGLEPLSSRSADEEREPENSSVLYMIGVANVATLSSESIKLRLSFVVNALLAIGVLFSSMALLWLWTGGDRLMLTFRHLLLFAATGLTAVMLYTLFGTHLVTRMFDGLGLDSDLEEVAYRIQTDFNSEFDARMKTLAAMTAKMLRAGETASRSSGLSATTPADEVRNSNGSIDEKIRSGYFCRLDPETRRQQLAQYGPDFDSRFPTFDLAFLLDESGKQWQCVSHRLFDTRPLALGFRDYFTRPKLGRLWQTQRSDDAASFPGFYMDRITSILDGSTETVLAARPDELCDYLRKRNSALSCPEQSSQLPSSVIIGRFHSLESAVLPAHMRFAVIDNASGETLFHSVGSRALATNFVRETETDDALLALVDSGTSGLVDLNYHGVSVRAFVSPLAPGIPWTLIAYRDHELADTLGVLTVSAAAAFMIGTLLPVTLILLLVAYLYRRVPARSWAWREALLSPVLVVRLRNRLLVIVLIATVLLFLVALVFPEFAGWLAFATMVSAPLLFALLSLQQYRTWQRASDPGMDSDPERQDRELGERGPVVAVLVMTVVTMTILPTIAWFIDLRTDLTVGVGDYLASTARETVTETCETHAATARRYKEGSINRTLERDGVFDHGWMLATSKATRDYVLGEGDLACRDYPTGVERHKAIDEAMAVRDSDRDRWSGEIVRAVGSFSGLANEIATRSAYSTLSDRNSGLARLHGMLLGPPLERPATNVRSPQRADWYLRIGDWALLLTTAIIGFLLVRIVVIAIADRVLGMRLRLGMLPPASVDEPPLSWRRNGNRPLRGCVVHRSEWLWEPFLASLMDKTDWCVRRARLDGYKIIWEELPRTGLRHAPTRPDSESHKAAADESNVLYVVSGFERFVVDMEARDALLTELEKLISGKAGILIWSRLLPGNWLANLSDLVSGDLGDVSAELAETARWSQVLGPFDVRRLKDRRVEIEQRFDQEMDEYEKRHGSKIAGGDEYQEARRAMLREAHANPELLRLAASVLRRLPPEAEVRGSLSQMAQQRFGAGAISHFHALWATSSREERLQLLAMARGGFANPTQVAPLASLMNRGLIATEGVLRLRSRAFGRFIQDQLDHDSLLHWRNVGHGNLWRSIWPPIVLVVVLAVAFFVSSTPEAIAPLAAILAAGLGAVPVVSSLLRGVQDLRGQSSE